jgi:divalent metal cation (Fe/Co/Zn/Cd) transporter
MFSFEPENIRWAGVLLGLIASSVAGTLFSNLITVARAHNSPKLINDCLARHQLAYVSFYLTVGLVVGRSNREWLDPTIFVCSG